LIRILNNHRWNFKSWSGEGKGKNPIKVGKGVEGAGFTIYILPRKALEL